MQSQDIYGSSTCTYLHSYKGGHRSVYKELGAAVKQVPTRRPDSNGALQQERHETNIIYTRSHGWSR